MEYFYSIFHFFVVYTACGLFLKRFGLNTRESFCHSGWLSLCLIYLLYKILFLLRIPEYSLYLDLILDSLFAFYIFKRSKSWKVSFSKNITFLCTQTISTKVVLLLFAIPLLYGFALALLLSPTTIDVNAYHESRILLMQQQGTYFLKKFNDICEVVYGLGYDLVLLNHLRFGEDRGLGIYGFVAFICITGFLYNFFNDKDTKGYCYYLPAILFLGLIEPIYQSFSAKNDLPGALACLGSIHLFINWKNSPSKEKFFLSLLAITWAVACKKVYLAFAAPMLAIWVLEWKRNKELFSLSTKQLAGGTIVLCLISPIFTYLYNIFLWGSWTGPEYFADHHKNQSLFLGTISNFFRYCIEIVHCPQFIESWFKNNLNVSITTILNHIWISFFLPIFGNHGESTWPFVVQWEQLEDSWFGPLGLILFAGFVIGLFLKKSSDQKYLFLLCGLIFLAMCNQLAWRPFNDRYFSLFFILLAAIHAKKTFLNSRTICRYICLTFSLTLLNWTVFFNKNLPTINFLSTNIKAVCQDISQNSVLVRTNFGREKLGYPRIPSNVIDNIENNARISIWTERYEPTASISRQLSDHNLEPIRYKVNGKNKVIELSELPLSHIIDSDYLLFFGDKDRFSKYANTLETFWFHNNGSTRVWALSKINKSNT